MASYSYAYRPTNREDLDNKFSEHNWFLPTDGELLRIGYHFQEYYATEDNEFNIFKKAIDKGVFTAFKKATGYGSTSKAGINQYHTLRLYNSSYGAFSMSTSSKESSLPSRPICSF